MKTLNNKPLGLLQLALTVAVGFALTAAFVPNHASATTAANATISNTATVNYDDSAGNAQVAIPASVDVTVNLVEATPTLNAPTDDSVFTGNAVDYTYTITSNANGVDIYDLSSTQTAADAGITGNTRVFRDAGDTGDITQVTVGATSVTTGITVNAAGNTSVVVPSDGAADASLNGIVATDVVWVNGAQHTVNSITDNATGTSVLELVGNGANNVLTAGMQIGERVNFIFRVTPTTTVDSDTVTNRVDAQDDAAADAAAQDTTVTTVLLLPSLTVTKYVRNITAGTNGGGTCITVDTGLGAGNVQYCDGTATGNPGETLEYIIEIANGGSAGQATDIVISDPVPAFTDYTTGTISLDPGTGTWSTVADTADNADFGETDTATVYIYAGSGGLDTAAGVGNGAGGSLNGGATTRGAFRVSIQ